MASGQEILQAGLSAMQEHGIGLGILPGTNIGHVVEDIIAAVAPLIAAAEREACAKVAERRWRDWPGIHPDDAKKGEVCDDVTACADIAAAIRARSDAP